MNKIYLFTAAFAVMASLSGCSDTELASIETAQEKTPIGFHTVGSQMGSRATSINSSEDLKSTTFNVYAFNRNDDGSDGDVFMGIDDTSADGVKISYQEGKLNYTTPTDRKYWPTNALNFYAVSPYSPLYSWQITNNKKEITYASYDEYGGDGSLTYTDVMYAFAPNKRKADNGGTVQLQFKHITSQIVFMAKKQPIENLNVEIKSIKLHNFETSGVFTIPTNRPDLQPQQSDWTPQSIPNHSGFTVINMKDDQKITIGTDATDISLNKPMFLIPQQLNAWNPSHDINTANTNNESYLSIECKISIDGSNIIDTETTSEKLYVPFGADWQPGKRYVYTLVFGGGYDKNGKPILQLINFEPSVGEWVEDATTSKDIPLYQ